MIDRTRGMIVNHWRGNYPLGRSFWLHYLALPTALMLVMLCCVALLGSKSPHAESIATGCLFLQCGVWIWALVGTLRAAKNDAQSGSKSLGRTAVRILLGGKVLLIAAVVGLYLAYMLLFLLFARDGVH